MDTFERSLVDAGRPVVRLVLENQRLKERLTDYTRILEDIKKIVTMVYSSPREPTSEERRIMAHFLTRCNTEGE